MQENESQILLLLGEIKGQVASFIAGLADANKRVDDHEDRIRRIETKASKQSGVIAGITIAATTVASAIGYAIHLVWPN